MPFFEIKPPSVAITAEVPFHGTLIQKGRAHNDISVIMYY